VTEGTDAQAEVSVRLSENGRSVTGRGADPDTMVASARAYVAALEKLMAKALGLPKSAVSVAAGQTARIKALAIQGMTLDEIRARLA
jgi:uncharacterized protein YggU (UPF0235/DUF167 family)